MTTADMATCNVCGRVVLRDTFEWKADWLDAPHKAKVHRVVRCPQHISKEALRYTYGIKRGVRQWAAQAKERDDHRPKETNPYIAPYPIPEIRDPEEGTE